MGVRFANRVDYRWHEVILMHENAQMPLADFIEYHRPALEANEVKYNLILGIFANAGEARLCLWTVGGSGECAIHTPGRNIILGSLSREQCRWLAEETITLDLFHEPEPLQIQALNISPVYPGVDGLARTVGADDATLFTEWMLLFYDEAVPNEPKPTDEQLLLAAKSGRYSFWTGRPVSMAGIRRRTRNAGAISGVYTPPSLRGRSYAGSVTAAVSERIFAEGKTAVCLYTDLRNPYSNRCYAKIGFKPVCRSTHYGRLVERKKGC
jgi:ribosomal protein S18 acetylase RimI-like enzyme